MAPKHSRPDGRADHEPRPLHAHPGYLRSQPGSVLLEAGNTRVLCSACLEQGVPDWMAGKGRGWLTAEYAMLPASTRPRKAREGRTGGGKLDGRSVEIQRLVGRSLRGVVDLNRLGENTVWVDCDVLEADGGTRTVAITGAWLALALGVRAWKSAGRIAADPLIASLSAVSVGLVDGRAILDLCYREDSAADVDMNVVMNGAEGDRPCYVEVQGTAEGSPFPRDTLDALLALAQDGCRRIAAFQKQVLDGTTPS